MTDRRLVRISLLTALAPAVWGSTHPVTTEFLPPDRPLLASTLRALPAGLILLLLTRVLPRGIWWVRAAVSASSTSAPSSTSFSLPPPTTCRAGWRPS
ncbi:hypothetical protein SCYAM73S_01382 [Streptomyces cyaneofuscatus]